MILDDEKFIRKAIEIAQRSRDNGNHPYGALLVSEQGQILLEAENSVFTVHDITAHAEVNLIRLATARYESDFLATCTIYASTEPCPMCSGAIFWANVKRVVYGLRAEKLYEMLEGNSDDILNLSCREVFSHGRKAVEVVGPVCEEEALKVHVGFWN